jgi:hypothetical protein
MYHKIYVIFKSSNTPINKKPPTQKTQKTNSKQKTTSIPLSEPHLRFLQKRSGFLIFEVIKKRQPFLIAS